MSAVNFEAVVGANMDRFSYVEEEQHRVEQQGYIDDRIPAWQHVNDEPDFDEDAYEAEQREFYRNMSKQDVTEKAFRGKSVELIETDEEFTPFLIRSTPSYVSIQLENLKVLHMLDGTITVIYNKSITNEDFQFKVGILVCDLYISDGIIRIASDTFKYKIDFPVSEPDHHGYVSAKVMSFVKTKSARK
jgi:hypothetical protein